MAGRESGGGAKKMWHDEVFFGIHYDLHAGENDTELGAALTHESLRQALEKAAPDWVQCDCKGHSGYTSWPTEVGSPSPGIVKDALRIHRDVTREMGIPLVMHYSGVWDSRARELHPDWHVVGPDGEHPEGGPAGGAMCVLSPYVDELLIPQMIELIDKYDVDGFWVDGECWAMQRCYCESCRAEFTKRTGIAEPPKSAEEANWTAWSDFHRTLFAEYVAKYAEAVHAHRPGVTACSNWMYTVGHPNPITAPVDYLSGDFTHAWSVYTAEIEARMMEGRGLQWDLLAWAFSTSEGHWGGWTLKDAAHLCQEATAVIPLGGAFSVYNQPQRSGHLTAWHQEILAEVGRFVHARRGVCAGTEPLHEAVVLHHAETFYAKSGALMSTGGEGREPLVGAVQGLLDNHIQTEILTEPDLTRRMGDYKLVVVPEMTGLSASFHKALRAFVEDGGCVVLSGPEVCGEFAGLAGVKPAGEAVEGYFYLQVGQKATTTKGPRRPVTLDGADVVRYAMAQQEPGRDETSEPAATLHRAGKGAVLAFHSAFFHHYRLTHYPRTTRLLGELIDALPFRRLIETDAPMQVRTVPRRQGNRLIVHLANLGTAYPTRPDQALIDEVPPTGPITLSIVCPRRPASVSCVPGETPVTWNWGQGRLKVRVPSVGILDSLVADL